MATYMTTVTASDLRKREPELRRLIESDGELEDLIDKASSDFCKQFTMEYGYNPEGDSYDMFVEFLALSYTFESLIKTSDVYIIKADRYRGLYNELFAKLNSRHDSGLYATCETVGVLR